MSYFRRGCLVWVVTTITFSPLVAMAFVLSPQQQQQQSRGATVTSRLSLSSSSKPDDDTTTTTTTTTTPTSKTRSNLNDDDDDDISKQLSNLLNVQNFMDNADTIRANVFAGEFGQRGELYVVAQVVLGLGVLVGGGDNIPILNTALTIILGPTLLLMGAAVLVLSIQELGAALSPWPTTVVTDKNDLVTDGVLYGQVRHPIYAGLLACCVGLSLITDSATRLLLTAALWYALELKTEFEEEDLKTKFPVEYAKYQQTVPTKFVPRSLLEALPWHNS